MTQTPRFSLHEFELPRDREKLFDMALWMMAGRNEVWYLKSEIGFCVARLGIPGSANAGNYFTVFADEDSAKLAAAQQLQDLGKVLVPGRWEVEEFLEDCVPNILGLKVGLALFIKGVDFRFETPGYQPFLGKLKEAWQI